MKKIKIAVTGGIGSGKSEFCRYLSEKGELVISADNVAKELLNSDEKIKKKITDTFGTGVYESGVLNVKYLAEKVFTDEKNVRKINSIVHPAAIAEINRKADEILQTGNIVFVESALIFEAGMEEIFDYIILITSDEETRIDRVVRRDDVNRDEVIQRMQNQMSDEKKKQYSDFTVHNNLSVEDLKNKADFFINLFKTICTSDQ